MLSIKWSTFCTCTRYTKNVFQLHFKNSVCSISVCVCVYVYVFTFIPATFCNHPVRMFYSLVLSALTNSLSYLLECDAMNSLLLLLLLLLLLQPCGMWPNTVSHFILLQCHPYMVSNCFQLHDLTTGTWKFSLTLLLTMK
jgi:hypothetical protein